MKETQREKIQRDVYEIVNRVEKNGRESEAVRVKLDIMLRGTPAINYKVLRLFTAELKDADIINLLFRLGVQSGTDMLREVAPKNGIQI